MNLKFKKLLPYARKPEKAFEGDLGYDIFSAEDVVLEPLKPAVIRTGIAVEFPEGWGAFVKDRSSMALKGIHTLGGVIDSGYRGEIKVVMISFKDRFEISAGDRIAQIVPIKAVDWKVEEVNDLKPTKRAYRGFGSTGGK